MQQTPTAQRNPWLVLIVLCTAVFMLLLDTTIVNVAQVKIKDDLGANLTQIQWVLDSYILTYAVLLLSLGRLGDVFGRKRLFIIGMGVFTLASGLCAASAWLGESLGVSGVNVLIAARVLQGLGGACMMPQTLALITVAFPPEKRGAALGIWGGIVALGAVVGPIIGGLIVTDYAWEWVFLINLPVGAAAILASRRIVPESVDPLASRRPDYAGVLLSGLGIFGIVFALIEGERLGWTSPAILGTAIVSIGLIVAFVLWERRAPDPMMKLELFAIRNFWIGNVIGVTIAFGMLGIFFPMTVFLQQVLGFSPIRAGLTMTPMSLALMVMAPVSGRLSDRLGARWILTTGLALVTAGILLIARQIDLQTDWRSLAPALLVTGAGMGMTFAPMTAAAMRDVPPRIAGSASGIINTMRNVGQVLGIAILGSLVQNRVVVHAEDRLAGVPLDPAQRRDVIELAKQSQFDQLVARVPVELAGVILDEVRRSWVDALHNTFLFGAAACLFGFGVALFLRDPTASPARASGVDRTAPSGLRAVAGSEAD